MGAIEMLSSHSDADAEYAQANAASESRDLYM